MGRGRGRKKKKDFVKAGAVENAIVIEANAFKETDVVYRASSSKGHADMVHTAELATLVMIPLGCTSSNLDWRYNGVHFTHSNGATTELKQLDTTNSSSRPRSLFISRGAPLEAGGRADGALPRFSGIFPLDVYPSFELMGSGTIYEGPSKSECELTPSRHVVLGVRIMRLKPPEPIATDRNSVISRFRWFKPPSTKDNWSVFVHRRLLSFSPQASAPTTPS
ncbi:hypothetical protein CCACVL1_18415 [Corchorus capsularis]|uniref:Uncharacterized protein n=1 Tax=Corchorus capsularis TaxID=210143 RepID=A0A1R3HLF5_COCAP|nr:hypothetical protein CCACVL1_18415 [Corchorus capsularis]